MVSPETNRTPARGLAGMACSWLCAGLSGLGRRRLPQIDGSVHLPGLTAPAEVIRDRWGIPHIYAANTHDLLFAQGYVHAQDRLWQMDFSRRLAAGRLSEVLGRTTLDVDRWIRIIGLRRAAERELPTLDAAARAALDAYAAGVNACIAQGCLPLEFAILHYRPEPWSPADSLSWNKMMSWYLSANWQSELIRAQLIARLGSELAAELEPDLGAPVIVPPGVDYQAIGQVAPPYVGPGALEGLGSNSWVLAGSRTRTGAPLLANDMHLLMALPAFWYENHLQGDGLNVTGVTFPGTPGVVAGHNGHVAWGFTNGLADVQDLYLERLRHLRGGRVEYEYRGEWHPARVHREEIRVRGGQTVCEEVVVTRHGPVINALGGELAGRQPLALRWLSLQPETTFPALLAMNRARNCDEFRAALGQWSAPVQNVVYADTQGNIAYSHAGRVPIRARGDGRAPVPGWSGEYEWTGLIPYAELPHLHNPPRGYIVTANNRVAADGYPYFLGCDYCSGDRAERISELIEAQDRIDPGYACRMQFDQRPPMARVLVGSLNGLQAGDPDVDTALELLRQWDGEVSADSPAAAVYEVLVRQLVPAILGERLGDLIHPYMGQGCAPGLADTTSFGFRACEWLQQVLADPGSRWFGPERGNSRDELVLQALGETVRYLRQSLGAGPADWAWGKLHRLTCTHPLGRIGALQPLFRRGPYAVGGDVMTVWATGSVGVSPHGASMVGPPFRFVADLGDLRRSLGLLAPGQSGHPCSSHYDDQMAAWLKGEYHPMLYAREDVEREAEGRLLLLPG